MKFYQENIKGHLLQLSVDKKNCNKGICEEYTSQYEEPSRAGIAYGHCATSLSLLLSLLLVLLVLQISSVLYTVSILITAVFIAVKTLFQVTCEQVLFVPNIGLQQTTWYACGLKSPHFIPCNNITDIIINEDIGWSHSFYLAVVLKDGDPKQKLFPLFQHTCPRLAFLQVVHNRVIALRA